jgi:hypothetical protein
MSFSDGADDSLVITEAAVDGGGHFDVVPTVVARGLDMDPPTEAAFEFGLQVDRSPSEAKSIDWKRLAMLDLDVESDTLPVLPASDASLSTITRYTKSLLNNFDGNLFLQ